MARAERRAAKPLTTINEGATPSILVACSFATRRWLTPCPILRAPTILEKKSEDQKQ